MSMTLKSPRELREEGFRVLVGALGWVDAVRFIQQYGLGQGDYTQERDRILPDWDAETLVQRARALTQD